MATIAEVRKQYPQYNDMSERQLADALHAKFYADVPKAEFDAKIGLKAGTAKAPAPKKDRGIAGYWAEEIGGAVSGAVDKLKRDVAEGVEAAKKPKPGVMGAIRGSAESLGRTGTILLDAVNVPLSPLAGVLHGAVVRPYGEAASALSGGAYPKDRAERDMGTALMAMGPGRARVPAPAKPRPMADNVAAFDRAKVRPTLAAVGGRGAAATAKAVAENPIAGVRARSALQGSLDDTADSASGLAGKYGADRGAQLVGDATKAEISTFAKGAGAKISPGTAKSVPSQRITFGDKADALYTGAERLITRPDAPVRLDNTVQALDAVLGQYQDVNLAREFTNPDAIKLAQIIYNAKGQLAWSDAAKLRTTIRTTMKADPVLRAKITDAQIDSIYNALTTDLETGAARLGGAKAAAGWRRANQFYRAGMQRQERALEAFAGATAGEGAYSKILQAAGSTSTADTQKLIGLKRSVSPEQWGDIAATTIKRMGRPTKGAEGALEADAFSVNTFVSNYAGMSPRGREILFGGLGGGGAKGARLKVELDNLARVAEMQKGVERAANTSKTMVSGQAIGTGALLLNPATVVPTAKILGMMALTGEAMTNPLVVRWLTRTTRAAQQGPQQLNYVQRQLRTAAKTNAALVPLYQQAARLLESQQLARSAAEDQTQTPTQ